MAEALSEHRKRVVSRSWTTAVVTLLVSGAVGARVLIEVNRVRSSPDAAGEWTIVVAICVSAVATVALIACLIYLSARPGLNLSRAMSAHAPQSKSIVLRKDRNTVEGLVKLGLDPSRVLKGLYLGATIDPRGISVWGNVPVPAELVRVDKDEIVSVRERPVRQASQFAAIVTSGAIADEGSFELVVRRPGNVAILTLGPLKWHRTAQIELTGEEQRLLVADLSKLWDIELAPPV